MPKAGTAMNGSDESGVVASLGRLEIVDVLVLVAFGVLFVLAARPYVLTDLGWHLRTGQLIWQTGIIPHSDPFSFTVSGQPWITHEWLSEVIMWIFYKNLGYPGLIAVCAGVTLLGLWFVYRQMRLESIGALPAGLLLVLCGLATNPIWGAIPLVTTLCLSPFYALRLRRWWLGDLRALWSLPPLMLLWVNLHGGYMIGLGLVGIYLIAGLLSGWLSSDPPRGSLRTLAMVGALCLLATLANPNTYHILWYPFDTLTSAAMRKYLGDWPSPNFHLISFLPFALMLALFFAAVARDLRRMAVIDVLLVLALAGMGLQSNRHVPLFAVICTPVLARHIGALNTDVRALLDRFRLTQIFQRTSRSVPPSATMAVLNWLLLLGAYAFFAWRVGDFLSPAKLAEVEAAHYPVQAVRYIKDQGIKGRIYNAYNWGGYLVLHWYPERQVFIDSRADVYRDEFIEEYMEAYLVRPRWRETLDKYSVDYALLQNQGPLHLLLKASGEWREVYADKVAVLLARAGLAGGGSGR
jgi:hypothetical protein